GTRKNAAHWAAFFVSGHREVAAPCFEPSRNPRLGVGRRPAAVRGGHYAPEPADRPHGPRRCGGPEHHGVFMEGAEEVSSPAAPVPCPGSDTCSAPAENQRFLNYPPQN